MSSALKIFALTIVVSLFYSYVGHMVPQKITYPPETVEIGSDLSTEEMVTIGEQIVAGKGTCLSCHTMGAEGMLRFPDLGNIGAVAGQRRDGMDAPTYLAESMYAPNDFIVEGFAGGMPSIGRPPINLNDDEILTVIAYLESLGGTPTVTMESTFEWQGQNPQGSAAPAAAPTAASTNLDGPALTEAFMCGTCHSFDAPTPGAGPTLYDVGARMSKAEIYEAIMEPDATIAEGYSPGTMTAMLNAIGFYDKISSKDLKTLVDYLASLQGS